MLINFTEQGFDHAAHSLQDTLNKSYVSLPAKSLLLIN